MESLDCHPSFPSLRSIAWLGGLKAFDGWSIGAIGNFFGNGKPHAWHSMAQHAGKSELLWGAHAVHACKCTA